MAYEKQTWNTQSYVNPTRMNHIEDGIADSVPSANFSYLGAKNLNSTPYFHSSGRVSNGVTFTVNDDGSITTSGTANGGDALFQCHTRLNTDNNKLILPNGNYILTGCASGGSSTKYNIQAIGTKNGSASVYGYDYGSGVNFTLNGDDYYTDKAIVGVYITIKNGVNATGLVFRPMIRLKGDTDATFQPYSRTNQQLTREKYDVATANLVGAKNLIPMSLSYLITQNTLGTWEDNVYTYNSVSYTVNTDSFGNVTKIIANGNNTSGSSSTFLCTNRNIAYWYLPAGRYTLNGCPSGGGSSAHLLRFQATRSGSIVSICDDFGYSATGSVQDGDRLQIAITVANGYNAQNLEFKPMVRVSSDLNDEFQPYAMTNQELTKKIMNRETFINAGNTSHTITFSGSTHLRCGSIVLLCAGQSLVCNPIIIGFKGANTGVGTITEVLVSDNSLGVTASGTTITIPRMSSDYGTHVLIKIFPEDNISMAIDS